MSLSMQRRRPVRPHRVLVTALIAVLATTAACGGEEEPGTAEAFPEGAFVVRASSDVAVGTERLLLGVVGPDNERLGSPDTRVSFELWPSDDPERVVTVPATWSWAVPGVSGLYRAEVDFDRPGIWNARVVPEDGAPLEPVPVEVRAEPRTPGVGTPAPRSETPTAADVESLAEISTDQDPDPSFYEISVADAVTSGRPSVIVFATPLYCQTAVCGPTLDDVKALAPDYGEVNWVHVEIFTNLDDPANRQLAPAVVEWQLPTEPWVFVVDAAGDIAARFEGVVDAGELRDTLNGLISVG